MNLSDVEKAAVLLIALGPDRSKQILEQLGTSDLLPIVGAMKRMRSIPHEVRRAVLLEVNRILHKLSGETAATVDDKGDDPATGLFRRLGPSLPSRIDPDRGAAWDGDSPTDGPHWDEPELPPPPSLPGDDA
jgi:hypothetical protein